MCLLKVMSKILLSRGGWGYCCFSTDRRERHAVARVAWGRPLCLSPSRLPACELVIPRLELPQSPPVTSAHLLLQLCWASPLGTGWPCRTGTDALSISHLRLGVWGTCEAWWASYLQPQSVCGWAGYQNAPLLHPLGGQTWGSYIVPPLVSSASNPSSPQWGPTGQPDRTPLDWYILLRSKYDNSRYPRSSENRDVTLSCRVIKTFVDWVGFCGFLYMGRILVRKK